MTNLEKERREKRKRNVYKYKKGKTFQKLRIFLQYLSGAICGAMKSTKSKKKKYRAFLLFLFFVQHIETHAVHIDIEKKGEKRENDKKEYEVYI